MSSSFKNQNEILNELYIALKNKSQEVRLAAARDLRDFVQLAVADLHPSTSRKHWDARINQILFDLVHNDEQTSNLGGIVAIDNLMDVDQETSDNLVRFYHYLTKLLRNPDLDVMVAASKSLGKLAKIGDQVLGEGFLEHQVPAAIELLAATGSQQSRYAGVLVLKELAHSSPQYFLNHIPLILDRLSLVLRDKMIHVRQEAAKLLAELLAIMATKEGHYGNRNYLVKLIDSSYQGLKTNHVEIIHGCLMTYRELMLHAGMAMKENFQDTVETIFTFKAHRDDLIRTTVIALIPTFALYDNASFSEHFLHKSMAHLLNLEKSNERAIAFMAIGHVAAAVRSDIKPFLESIMSNIRNALQMRGKKVAPPEEPIFQCIGMLASSVGPNIAMMLYGQLDLMFQCGLSEPLRAALAAIALHLPQFLPTIQDRLLDMLSVILIGVPYKSLGAPTPTRPDGRPNPPQRNQDIILLALNTLGSFDFTGHVLNEFVRDAVIPYCEDNDPEVRKAAIITCCGLFVHDPICHQSSNRSVRVISDVLDKLVAVAVADPEPTVRRVVLSSLDHRLDKHLTQAEYMRTLFITLNDECFANRVLAIPLIGRLAMHNPAYAMPSLRKALIQLLTELNCSTIARSREEASRLLTHLASATGPLIKPYSPSILQVVLPKANDPNPVVASQALMCLGELSIISGEEVKPHIPAIMSVIVSTLSTPTAHSKLEAALLTLGQLCTNTSYVIAPIVEYPQLTPLLGRVLKAVSSPNVRRQTIRVLGILGAIDPYRSRGKGHDDATLQIEVTAALSVVPVGHRTSSIYDYQTVVIDALLRIMKDESLKNQHYVAVDSIMSIFKTQGLSCVSFLPQVISAFDKLTRSANARLQEHHLEQLAILISIVKEHSRNGAQLILGLIHDLWENASLQLPLVTLIEALAKALGAEFRPFLPSIFPRLVKVFEEDLTDKLTLTLIKVLQCFLAFGAIVEEYLHLVIPVIVKTYERPYDKNTILLRKTAINTIEGLCQKVHFSDHASRIIHPLVRILTQPIPELRHAVMNALCALVYQLVSDFVIFIPTIKRCLTSYNIRHDRYEKLVNALLNEERLPSPTAPLDRSDDKGPEPAGIPQLTKMTPNQAHLKQAWDISQVTTKEDWQNWFRRISAQFMKESPSAAIRSCVNVLDAYPQIARELFNTAFLSCWEELDDQGQDDLAGSIKQAITHPNTSADLVHVLLNLAEFMDLADKRIPIENKTLGEYALQFHAHAKALRYKELEFFRESTPTIVETLIAINVKLQQHDAAWGTLTVARAQHDVFKHEEWFERLGRWQEALDAYEKKAEIDPHAPDIILGRMRCIHALGDWPRLAGLVSEYWPNASNEGRREMAPLAAAAAWSLHDWDSMGDYISVVPSDSADGPFYRAILAIHRNQFHQALAQIVKARDLLDPALTSVIGEHPSQTSNLMVRAQMLSELEEIIAFKQFADRPDCQDVLRKTWKERIFGCEADIEIWQRILQVRALVLRPEEEPQIWLKFANLCRKNGRMALAEKVINGLTQAKLANPHITYSQLKLMWDRGDKQEALAALKTFCETLQRDIPTRPGESEISHQDRIAELPRLLARCFFKAGQWKNDMRKKWTSLANVNDILQAYYSATQLEPKRYKAWHTWSLANVDAINFLESQSAIQQGSPAQALVTYVTSAIDGLFRSIGLRNGSALQDMLRLLTLWFKYGVHDDVNNVMMSGCTILGVDRWLEVVPQIIARIQTPTILIRKTINAILTALGKHHPQALVHPLTVASASSSLARKNAALAIMDRMREHSGTIIEQALMVSRELVRAAILWHELWHEGLEEASRLFFINNNPEAMIATLEPLHELVEQEPRTIREASFVQVFGGHLQEAREATKQFLRNGDRSDLNHAWDIYYGVFRKIAKQLPELTTLDLEYVSPELLKAKDLELAVPGTYQSGRDPIRIASFVRRLSVFQSKQKPRQLFIKGSNGQDYQYILKGREDLRQDERVMQLFGLVNALLSQDTNSLKRQLHIQAYAVTPLAPNAGLISCVENIDTLHALIRDYREARKILVNLEYHLIVQMAPDYLLLPSLQKVEAFEHALDNTTGQDLYRMLWLRSASSEAWLDRRTTYTRSLAVNSIIGYILGLGDRHPSNILIERASAKVVHIDFGECFEVSMRREKFPEMVPFRLTRMLVHAMEVGGVQGTYKNTCNITMQVARDNGESLMAVLEAFVYDPLINWRLVQTEAAQMEDTNLKVADELAEVGYLQGPSRKPTADENEIFNDGMDDIANKQEVLNVHALRVYNRVQLKLRGREFDPNVILPVEAHVDRLIEEATSVENLAQCFLGWCPFW